jgi:hypothetical protein
MVAVIDGFKSNPLTPSLLSAGYTTNFPLSIEHEFRVAMASSTIVRLVFRT